MIIATTSDTHGDTPTIPKCDLLIHCGDILRTFFGRQPQCRQLECDSQKMWWQDIGEEWLESIDTPEIIIIPGNHDFLFEQYQHKLDQLIPKLKNKIIHIVTNDVITTKHTNLKVLCNSWTPYFLSWAFNGPENPIDAQEFFDKMYDKFTNQTVDIVATHGPPKSVLDITNRNQQSVGCAELGRLVKLIKPKYHIFGHIHEARGAKVDDSGLIHYINTACVVNSIVL